jgi:hypothetical protein
MLMFSRKQPVPASSPGFAALVENLIGALSA